MPHIILVRDDIESGLLTTLDLRPMTSQRNTPYQKAGQTRYLKRIPNEEGTTLASGVVQTTVKGLTAWLLGRVSSNAGTNATAAITTVAVSSLVDGDYFTINDGQGSEVFAFVVTSTYAVPIGRTAIDVSGVASANEVRDAVIAAINASTVLDVLAASGGAATVSLTNNNQNQSTALQNNTSNSENVANGTFAVTDFSSATNSDPMTVPEAIVVANEILGLAIAGEALTLASINGTITTGKLIKAQISELLSILEGGEFTLSAAEDIGTTQFTPAGAFSTDAIDVILALQDTESFKSSWRSGRIATMRSANYFFLGETGAAISIYNVDGSVYVGA